MKSLDDVYSELVSIRALLELIPVESRIERGADGELSIVSTTAGEKVRRLRAETEMAVADASYEFIQGFLNVLRGNKEEK